MFVKKLSINILTLYEMFYKGLRRGILIFYANTFKLLTSKHMRLQKGDSNMQFQLQFITDERRKHRYISIKEPQSAA